jgi:hypothetical protein
MKRFLLLSAAVTLALTSTVPVQAGGADVAAGLIGGLAAGTIIGAAVTAPRYYGPHRCMWRPRHTAIGRKDSRCGTHKALSAESTPAYKNSAVKNLSVSRPVSQSSPVYKVR